MASAFCARVPATATVTATAFAVRRRLPLVGAVCLLSFGFSNYLSSLSSSSTSSSSIKTGNIKSSPFGSLLKSKFCTLSSSSKTATTIEMEGSNDTVPSIVVYVTVPNREAGKKLAGSLVKEKLAACVNIVPGVESVYQWEGKIESDSEELLIVKTRQSLLEALTEHVNKNHEYDVPEVIALPITGGSPQYLGWLKNSTRE